MKFAEVIKLVEPRAAAKPLAIIIEELDGTKLSYFKKESTGSLEDLKCKPAMKIIQDKTVLSYTETPFVLVIYIERGSGRTC